MTSNSFARHQFPPDVIRHAVRLYLRFTLSLRDVKEMLGERGLDLTYEQSSARSVLSSAPQLSAYYRRSLEIGGMNLENLLDQIQPDRGNLFHGTAPCLWRCQQRPR